MAVVTLTFTASDEEIVSGVPVSVEITSNIPSTIYYTIDGTVPTENSPIYISAISMPDNTNSVVLSAFGVDADGYDGAILTQTFAPDTTRIDVTRNVNLEGFVVDRFSDPINIEDGFDADGNPVRYIDHELVDLDIIHSSAGKFGIAEGAQIEIGSLGPTETPTHFDDNFVAVSTPESAQLFNPYAKTIVIDNRIDNEVQILNRPLGSIRKEMTRSSWGQSEVRGTDETYVSGGFVRTLYSARHNTMVSYYFDHNELRHIKSIQSLPSNIPGLNDNFTYKAPPLIFKWIDRGRHSTIPL